jgi:hypothetical protein
LADIAITSVRGCNTVKMMAMICQTRLSVVNRAITGETNMYGHRIWSIQPDRYAYPSCTDKPHPIVTQSYNEYPEYIDDEKICESFPLIPVAVIWVCGIPPVAKSDAGM